MVTLEDELLRLTVDERSGYIIDLYDKYVNARHISVRRPELRLLKEGMGVFTSYPPINVKSLDVNGNVIRIRSDAEGIGVSKEVSLNDGVVNVTITTHGSSIIRESLHLACCRGGFWAESPSALYSCRYFVKFGFDEIGDLDSYTSIFIKPPVSGFSFKKNSYIDRYFPSLKWAAFIDTAGKCGLVVRCLSGDCIGIIEDQMFNVDLELIRRCQGDCELRYMLIPVHGLRRVDYVSESMVAGVELPSVVKPSDEVHGSLVIIPLKDTHYSGVESYVELRKSLSQMGRRGYVLDRTIPSVRRYGITIESHVDVPLRLSRRKPVVINFRVNPGEWDPEYYSHSMPLLIFRLGNEEVRRALSVNEDFEEALNVLKNLGREGLLGFIDNEWSDDVEGFFDEKDASLSLYELAVESFSSKRRLLNIDQLRKCSHACDLLKAYAYSEDPNTERYGLPTSAVSSNILKEAVRYVAFNDESALTAAIGNINRLLDSYRQGTLVHWFNGIHGGAGSAGLFNLVLAYDLLEDYLPGNIKLGLMSMFRWAQGELIKITNAWVYPLGNWELTEALALLAISSKFNFKNSDLGMVKAIAAFRRGLSKGFLPDGGWVELSAAYHNSALNNSTWAAELLRATGGPDLYSFTNSSGKHVIKAAAYWLWEVTDENWRTPALEDSGSNYPDPDPFIIGGVRYGDELLLGIGLRLVERGILIKNPLAAIALSQVDENLLNRARGLMPRHSRFLILNDSGRFIARVNELDYFILDYGPNGGWHGHPDKLSFELHINGVPIIVDSGADSYYGDRHWVWHRRSIAHNTVTLRDEDQAETRGRLINYNLLRNGFEALFEAETYSGVVHRRFVKAIDRVYFIKDYVKGDGRFRFNLNIMGTVKGKATEDGLFKLVVSNSGLEYIIVTPRELTIGSGWRGHDESTLYAYYELDVRGEGVLWGLIMPSGAQVSLSGCVLSIGGIDLNVCG
jgi:hypothetical protein